jgi:hypothetical protein
MALSKKKQRELDATPKPGSQSALDAGCACPVTDNANGKGAMGGGQLDRLGRTIYIWNTGCVVHREWGPLYYAEETIE